MEKTTNRLLFWVKFCIFLSLLTPLVLGKFGISLSNFPKAIFFRSLIEIAFIFYLILIILNKKYLPKISIISIAYFIFIIFLFISAIFGVNFGRSLWGDPFRGEGIILHLHLFTLFIMLSSEVFSKKNWLWVLRGTVLVGGISAFAAILQKLGIVTLYGLNLPDRVSGTWTNPDFFAPYILLNIFLCLFVLCMEKEKSWRYSLLGIFFLDFLVLILSSARSSWLGFFAGFLPLAIYWFIASPVKIKKKKIAALLFSLFIIIFLLILIYPPNFLKSSETFKRFSTLLNPMSFFSPTSDRWVMMKISFEAFKDKPILGWGTEVFSFVYDKYCSREGLARMGENIYFDRAHNKFLDQMATTGIIGLLSYLSLFIIPIILLLRRSSFAKAPEDKYSFLARLVLACLLFAHLVQNFFIFDTIGTYLILSIVMAFIGLNFANPSTTLRVKNYFLPVILFLICFSSYLLWFSNIKELKAGRHFVNGFLAQSNGLDAVFSEYEKGVQDSYFYKTDLQWEFADGLLSVLGNSNPNKITEQKIIIYLQKILPALEDNASKLDRKHRIKNEMLARIYDNFYLFYGEKEYLNKMENSSDVLVNLNSNWPECHRILGRVKIYNGDFAGGEEEFWKIRELYINFGPGEKISLYRNLGNAYLKIGEKRKAAENFEEALKIDLAIKKSADQVSKEEMKIIGSPIIFLAKLYCIELKDKDACLRVRNNAIDALPVYAKDINYNFDMLVNP